MDVVVEVEVEVEVELRGLRSSGSGSIFRPSRLLPGRASRSELSIITSLATPRRNQSRI